MSFSKHLGMEPAADLKTRIQTLCGEAGLEVLRAEMHLHREESMQESRRIIHVWVREPGWEASVSEPYIGTAWEEHRTYQFEVRAIIGVDGKFDGEVSVQCSATDVVGDMWEAPTLRTNTVALRDLPPFLVKVARQQREIIAARKAGSRGPWRFGEMYWREPKP